VGCDVVETTPVVRFSHYPIGRFYDDQPQRPFCSDVFSSHPSTLDAAARRTRDGFKEHLRLLDENHRWEKDLEATYLTKESPFPGDVKWNFQKYLVDRKGNIVAMFPSCIKPTDTEFMEKLGTLLNEKS